VLYYNATINMAKKFRRFYINHVPRQQNAHTDALTSLATSLVLPVGATDKVRVHSRDLHYSKFALEDRRLQKESFKSMRFLRLQ